MSSKREKARDIEIGQWQQRCHQLQMQIDAYRTASSQSIEAMRDAYRKELGDFVQYNESWKTQINDMIDAIKLMRINITDIEMKFNELNFKFESGTKK